VEGIVVTYVIREPGATRPTSPEYADHILNGLREHDAPKEYRDYVKERIRLSNPSLAAGIENL
jgi:hypothetical protein